MAIFKWNPIDFKRNVGYGSLGIWTRNLNGIEWIENWNKNSNSTVSLNPSAWMAETWINKRGRKSRQL
jgi:hypothetical protein